MARERRCELCTMSDKLSVIKQLSIFTPDELRFWSYVLVGDGCWEWQGAIGHGGYGFFHYQKRTVKAHRLALHFMDGAPLRSRLVVRHRCHNHRCVNPDHLLLGTHASNTQDKIDAGHAKGQGKFTKLRPDQHEEIRRRYQAGGITQLELSRGYGVSLRHVQSICRPSMSELL